MKKTLKYLGILLAGLIGLLVLLIVILKLIPDDQYKAWITSAVESSTGRSFAMESLQLDFGTSLRIGADNVQLASADWAEKPEMLSVNHLDAELKLFPLLSGRAEIFAHLDTADIFSESNQDGISNWVMSSGDPEEMEEEPEEVSETEEFSGLPIRPIIRELRIDGVTLSLLDNTGSDAKTAVIKHLLIETPELETTLSLDADVNGIPVRFAGNLGNIDAALDQLSTPMTLDSTIDENKLKISGEWGPFLPDPNLNLVFGIEVPSTSSIAGIAGYDVEDFGLLEFTARVRADKGAFSVEDIVTSLDGQQTTTSIEGGISDLMLLDGVDIGVELNTESLERLVRAFNIELPVPLPPEVQLSAKIQGGKDGLGVNDINVVVRDEGVELQLSGAIEDILGTRQIEAQLSGNVDSLSRFSKYANMELPALGALSLSGTIQSEGKAIGLKALDLALTENNLKLTVTGSVEDLLTVNGINAQVDADIMSFTEQNISELSALLKAFEVELPVEMLPQSLKLSTGIEGNLEQLALKNISAEVHDDGTNITLTGAVDDVLSVQGIEAKVNATVDSLSGLSKYANMDLPALGAISLSGHLRSQDKALGLDALDLALTADNLALKISGGVEDLLTVNGIKAQVDADIKSLTTQNISELTALLESFKVELPVEMLPQSLKLSTGVEGNLQQLALQDISAEVLDKGIKISVLGAVENVLAPAGVSANITLNSDSIALFSKYANTELPDLGPLEATASIESSGESYTLKSLKANLAAESLQADVTASIADLLAVSGIQAEVSANTPSLASLSGLAQTELPDTDPVKVDATLSGENLEQTKIVISAESAGATVAVNSLMSLLNVADQLQMDVSIKAENLSNFDRFVQMELPDKGPLDLSTSISIEPGAYTLSALKLQLDEQSASGDFKLKLPGADDEQGITLLHGQLDIPFLDLSPFLVSDEPTEEPTDTVVASEATEEAPETIETVEQPEEDLTTPLAESDRLLSSKPILFELLHDYDVDLDVTAKKLGLGKADLKDLHVKVLLNDGLLNITPIQGFGSTGGTIDGVIQVDGRSATPILDANLTFNSIPLPNLGGTADFHLDIDGQGQSVAALMASLNGQIILVARDGTISSSFATRFGGGLMSNSGSKETTELECLILRVEIKDGVADFKNKLAAQLTGVTWRGGGFVDFNTERLSVDIAPKPRKGVGISISGGLAGLVKLSGTLKDPVVRPDYSDAAVKYAKYSAYVATGGLSLLAEIIANKVNANKDVCEQILDDSIFAAADKAEKKNLPK